MKTRQPLSLACASLLLTLSLQAAAADPAGTPSLAPDLPCSLDSVEAALTVRQLRSLRQRCVQNGDIYAHTLVKTNSLPLPLAPALRLGAAAPVKESEPFRAELGVFYYLHESYPTEAGFNDLDRLIRTLGNAWRIDAVQIVGGVDRLESGLTFARNLAQQRAQVIGDYLRDAGLSEKVPVTIDIRAPRYDDSEMGRAEDRSAQLIIRGEQRRLAPTAMPAPAAQDDDDDE